ncbi:DUF488 domain-containing protein [Zhihengliuella salsuginis]|uniref:DUF488 family protein n=1 Tax=Zhihengliuella salsuginis TaxID=578222 RepID=A0ABQ3GKC8_9MICC|nr:DUF488 family protein [Zhihengliuella salsuginis]GHD10906.1 hypothetical protein GCM10008096_24940 [Zhihengliuella salsuginis]
MTEFRIKRVYDAHEESDGLRILVDRLWPRGVAKDRLHGEWLKDVAPSPELRTAWHHDPDRFEEFAAAYRSELEANEAVAELREMAAEQPVTTLLFAARDEEINQAAVLRDFLNEDS